MNFAGADTPSSVLEFLMSGQEWSFSREQLLDSVWGHDRAVRTGPSMFIPSFAQKIEPDATNPTFIRSVRGFGYNSMRVWKSRLPERLRHK